MRWIVCFTNVKQVGLAKLSPFRRKFTHCYLVKYDQLNEMWNLLEFHTGGFRFSAKKGEKADPMVSKMLTDAVCIEVTPKDSDNGSLDLHFRGFTAYLSANMR